MHSITRHIARTHAFVLALVLALSGCTTAAKPPVFQPLTLDLSGDIAPRDPSLPPAGDVYCVIGHGTAMLDGQWRPYDSTGFVLPGNGMMSSVRMASARGNYSGGMRAYYDEPGQKMIFCPAVTNTPGGVIDCASLYAMNEDLLVGIKRTFDVPNGVQSGHITCAYSQENLQKL